MKTASAKNKGRLLQNFVRDRMMKLSGMDSQDIRGTGMGASGEDILLSKAARRVFPVQIECKNHARYAVYNDYEQACGHGPHEPVVIIKQNRSEPLAVVDAEYFLTLLYKANKNNAD